MQLTHLDAAYFMIGTLSAAGTADIVATSELTQALRGVQMLFDRVPLGGGHPGRSAIRIIKTH
jgi:hypothetical protein